MKYVLRLLLVGLMWLPVVAVAQTGEVELAEKYFTDGEYENALNLFQKFQKKEPESRFFNQRVAFCLQKLERYEDGIDFLDKVIKKNPNDNLYPFLKADLLRLNGDLDGATALEENTIEKKLETEAEFMEIGTLLYQEGKNQLALKTYLEARKELKDPYLFGTEVANLYSVAGEYAKSAEEYLGLLDVRLMPQSVASVNILNLVDEGSKDEVEGVLLAAVQKNSSNIGLRTIVFEFYVLTKNFYEAFIQVKSIDKVNREDGRRVYNYALTLRNNKEYRLSNKALDYIIDKHEGSPYYLLSFKEKTVNNELQAFESVPLDTVAIREAVVAYEDLLKTFGRKSQFFDAMYRKANLQAFYLFDLPGAQSELDKVLNLPIKKPEKARANLLYGDVLLMQKEFNRAKLKYNEVAEAYAEGQIGALAKYKQGRLSYFKGDFEYSQARLKTIKDNTSNDISNDAIKLFLTIQDNIGLDTTTLPLERFAQAQLLVFQRDFEPALTLLDSIAYAFPNHTLSDDIVWEKANIFLQQNDIEKTLVLLDKVIDEFPEDIHADDALYTKARIHDFTLNKKEEAMQYYIQFLRSYSGSLYIVSVRKRIRELRQDQL